MILLLAYNFWKDIVYLILFVSNFKYKETDRIFNWQVATTKWFSEAATSLREDRSCRSSADCYLKGVFDQSTTLFFRESSRLTWRWKPGSTIRLTSFPRRIRRGSDDSIRNLETTGNSQNVWRLKMDWGLFAWVVYCIGETMTV